MNVSPTGGATPNLDPPGVKLLANLLSKVLTSPSLPSISATPTADRVSGLLPELSAPAIQDLLHALDRHVASIHQGVHTDSIQTPLLNAPPILDTRLFEIRQTAEKSVAKAAHAIETASSHTAKIPANIDPQFALTLANRFMETGQLSNYLRAEELGRVIVSWYDQPLPVAAGTASRPQKPNTQLYRFAAALKIWWRRAPMLLLLAGWLLSGLTAVVLAIIANVTAGDRSLLFKIWAIGFPALIVFQFLVTVWSALRLKPTRTSRNPAADR